MTDCITVFRARAGLRLAKLLHADGQIDGYDKVRTVDAFTVRVSDLAGIQIFLQRLLHRPDCCVVRGELVNGHAAVGIRRLQHTDREPGEPPAIRDVPRRWLTLDMEGVMLPHGRVCRRPLRLRPVPPWRPCPRPSMPSPALFGPAADIRRGPLMSRQQRRGAGGKIGQSDLTPVILNAAHCLAHLAAPTATGATIFMQDGTRRYLSIETAHAIVATRMPNGQAQ